MRFYDSLKKQLREFEPIDKNNVRIYSCGPTVYDHAHIGNLSSYIYADTLRRVLELEYNKVTHVMNYTDVDDKTIRRSQEKYPDLEPKEALKKLTDEYIDLFKQDIEKVGIDTSKITFVRATEQIDHMKELIVKLLNKKIAYITDDGVYFSIEAYRASGKTYGQLLKISADNTSEARIDNDEYDKESAHDFALWKIQRPGEPAWDFEVEGKNLKGRPGWHIECSAMSEAALGLPFDIHTGGIDLIFPHHENEIAQSTGAIEEDAMANYFVHNNHLLVDGKKMAKSAQNFYTLDDIVQKGFDPLAFRLLVLQSHYRNEVNFTWESLSAAQSRAKDIQKLFDREHQINPAFKPEWAQGHQILGSRERFEDAITENINVPGAFEQISDLESDIHEGINADGADEFSAYLNVIERVLGLQLERGDISDGQKELIKSNEAAREEKDYQAADSIRDDLRQQGIGIQQTDHGPIWYRI